MGRTNVYVIARLSDVPFLGHLDVPLVVPPDVPESGHKEYPVKEDPKKKKKISNFELPTPIKRTQPVTPEFKITHPDLWQAGCSGVAEFIKTVGRGLWTDEAMNLAQWQAHADAKRLARK